MRKNGAEFSVPISGDSQLLLTLLQRIQYSLLASQPPTQTNTPPPTPKTHTYKKFLKCKQIFFESEGFYFSLHSKDLRNKNRRKKTWMEQSRGPQTSLQQIRDLMVLKLFRLAKIEETEDPESCSLWVVTRITSRSVNCLKLPWKEVWCTPPRILDSVCICLRRLLDRLCMYPDNYCI